MGYTHYWYRVEKFPRQAWDGLTADVRAILANLPETGFQNYSDSGEVPLVIRGWDGTGEPVIDADQVSFNGDASLTLTHQGKHYGEGDHETFCIERIAPTLQNWRPADVPLPYFGFCKTAQKPYSPVVCAVLIRLAYRFPEGVRIESDGETTSWDWQWALDYCRHLFGYARIPFRDEAPADAAD